MKVFVSESAPQLISPLDEGHPILVKVQQACLKALLDNKAKKVGSWNTIPLWLTGSDKDGCYFLAEADTKAQDGILYFVKYSVVRLPRAAGLGAAVRQVLVWRNPKVGVGPAGVAHHVFFNVLLPKYGALVTDRLQTQRGQQFWEFAVAEALRRGLIVELLNQSKQKTKRVHSTEELYGLRDTIWGPTLWFRDVLLVIKDTA